MKAKQFNEALSEIGDRYVEEAAEYRARPSRTKWVAAAACIAVVAAALVLLPLLRGTPTVGSDASQMSSVPENEIVANDPGGDYPPMVYVDGVLYKISNDGTQWDAQPEDAEALGQIGSVTKGEPDEDLQANTNIVGAQVCRCEGGIAVEIDGVWWLYERLDAPDTDWDDLTEQEREERDPNYNAD